MLPGSRSASTTKSETDTRVDESPLISHRTVLSETKKAEKYKKENLNPGVAGSVIDYRGKDDQNPQLKVGLTWPIRGSMVPWEPGE